MDCPYDAIKDASGNCICQPGYNFDQSKGTCYPAPNNSGSNSGAGNNFWQKVGNVLNQYGPGILIGAGGFWASKQNGGQQQTQQLPQTPPPPKDNTNTYLMVGAGVVVVGLLLWFMLRRPNAAMPATR